MNGPITLTFVGGPEDGKRIRVREVRDFMKFNVLPRLPTYVASDEPIPDLVVEQFTYRVEKMPGDNYVAYPAYWRDAPEGHLDQLVTGLVRGYVGRP